MKRKKKNTPIAVTTRLSQVPLQGAIEMCCYSIITKISKASFTPYATLPAGGMSMDMR